MCLYKNCRGVGASRKRGGINSPLWKVFSGTVRGWDTIKTKPCHYSAPSLSLSFVSLRLYISRQSHHWHASLAAEFSVVKTAQCFFRPDFLWGVTIPHNEPATARYKFAALLRSPANKAALFAALFAALLANSWMNYKQWYEKGQFNFEFVNETFSIEHTNGQ